MIEVQAQLACGLARGMHSMKNAWESRWGATDNSFGLSLVTSYFAGDFA